MRLLLAVLLALSLSACSSVPVEGESDPVPVERLYMHQQADENSATLIVNRDVGYLGGGCHVAILIDRKVAARIRIGETAAFHVSPGAHILGIGADTEDPSLCGRARLNRELLVRPQAGEVQTFHIVSEAKSGFDIRPRAVPEL